MVSRPLREPVQSRFGPPEDLTSFVGRRAEMTELKRLVGRHRLVTLTGVGGVGKTKLAARVATEVGRRTPDGAVWVELADLRDPSLLWQTIEDRLAISEKVGRDPRSIVINHLRARSMLLVLDNAEHLLDACARLVHELWHAAPGLRLLVTSRQALGVPAEQVNQLAPLEVPGDEHALEPGAGLLYPALALFEERAAASSPGFAITSSNQAVVAHICRRLDGIPLAIELATVKLRVLSVDELAARLDSRLDLLDNPGKAITGRHQTLQATIRWSYDLCSESERLLWARSSVFAGGFGVEAAEMCCSDDLLPRAAILEAITGLIDKSVLVRTEVSGRVRFKLLEPLREHGLSELISRKGLDDAEARHLAWCAELIRQASMQWFGPAQERWCVSLQLEHANIRAAAEYCLRAPDRVEDALRLLGEPWFLWVALFLDEGRHWLDRALALPGTDSSARAKAFATAGYVAALQGDLVGANQFVADSRSMATQLSDRATLAYAMHIEGLIQMFVEPAQAIETFEKALSLYESVLDEVNDDYVIGMRVQLGLAHVFVDSIDQAAAQFSLCRNLCTVTGERWLLSYALYGEAFVNMMRGEYAHSLELTREALSIKRFFGDALGQAVCLDLLAWTHAELDQTDDAALLLGVSARVWDSVGPRLFGSPHWVAKLDRAMSICESRLGSTRLSARMSQGHDMSLDQGMAFALDEREKPVMAVESGLTALTPREREIAELVAEGLSNRDIAQRLSIAQRTAECHVENILTKFGFRSRTQIATWVAENRQRASV